jgi:hypothetical protein
MSSRPVSGFTILSVRFRVGCPAAWGRYAKLFIATPMHRTQLCKAGFRGSADLSHFPAVWER